MGSLSDCGVESPKKNRLTTGKIVKIANWIKENHGDLLENQLGTYQVAAELSDSLGFYVSSSNVNGLLKDPEIGNGLRWKKKNAKKQYTIKDLLCVVRGLEKRLKVVEEGLGIEVKDGQNGQEE